MNSLSATLANTISFYLIIVRRYLDWDTLYLPCHPWSRLARLVLGVHPADVLVP